MTVSSWRRKPPAITETGRRNQETLQLSRMFMLVRPMITYVSMFMTIGLCMGMSMDMLVSVLVGMALTHFVPVCMAMFMSVLMRTFHNSSLVQAG